MVLSCGLGNTKSAKEETQKAQRQDLGWFVLFAFLPLRFLCFPAAHLLNLTIVPGFLMVNVAL
jgi:hypothetical protein